MRGSDPRPLLEKAVRDAQNKLKGNKEINSKFSGCTGTILVVDTKSKSLYSCNVGDSRIILGRGKQKKAEVVEVSLASRDATSQYYYANPSLLLALLVAWLRLRFDFVAHRGPLP